MKLVWQLLAAQDIDDIWEYSFRTWGLVQADTYIRQLRDRAQGLVEGTVNGRNADDIGVGLKRLGSGSHVIWFRTNGASVEIVRVLHQNMNFGIWLE